MVFPLWDIPQRWRQRSFTFCSHRRWRRRSGVPCARRDPPSPEGCVAAGVQRESIGNPPC
eukprot:1195981-Prorocentrum_minimum.AAC.4